MNRLLLMMIALTMMLSCKKDKPDDTSLKRITYTLSTGGASAQLIYVSHQDSLTRSTDYEAGVYSISDQAKIGDKIFLHMTAFGDLNSLFEIRVTNSGNKVIARKDFYSGATGAHLIILEKTLTASDFK